MKTFVILNFSYVFYTCFNFNRSDLEEDLEEYMKKRRKGRKNKKQKESLALLKFVIVHLYIILNKEMHKLKKNLFFKSRNRVATHSGNSEKLREFSSYRKSQGDSGKF